MSQSNQPFAGLDTTGQVTLVKVISFLAIYTGNPNGNVGGQAGSSYVLPDMLWDTVNLQWWICTTAGSATTAAWSTLGPGTFTAPAAFGYGQYLLWGPIGSPQFGLTFNSSGVLSTTAGTVLMSTGFTLGNAAAVTLSANVIAAGGSGITGALHIKSAANLVVDSGGTITVAAGGTLAVAGTATGVTQSTNDNTTALATDQFVQTAVANGIAQLGTIYSGVATGSTLTPSGNTRWIEIQSGGLLSALTINLGSLTPAVQGPPINIISDVTISTLTITGATAHGAPSTMSGNTGFSFRWNGTAFIRCDGA